MEIKEIIRRGKLLFVRVMKVSELDKSKCSHKFLSYNFDDDKLINVKCYPDGTFDLRGKKEEYRFIIPDNYVSESLLRETIHSLRVKQSNNCINWVEGIGDCRKPECDFCRIEKSIMGYEAKIQLKKKY